MQVGGKKMSFNERFFVNTQGENPICYLPSAGIVYPDEKYSLNRRVGKHLWEYVISGEGHIIHNGMEYHLTAGDFCYVKKGLHVRYFSDGNNPYHKLWFGADGQLVEKLAQIYLPDVSVTVQKADVSDPFRRLITMLKEGCYDEGLACHALLDIFMTVSRASTCPMPASLAERIKKYIDDHIFENPSLNSLGETFNISGRHLIRVFKARYGIPPGAYMINKKLNLACRYLVETEFGIGQIAQILGYCDQSYFSSEFKKHYGIYPTVYRNRGR